MGATRTVTASRRAPAGQAALAFQVASRLSLRKNRDRAFLHGPGPGSLRFQKLRGPARTLRVGLAGASVPALTRTWKVPHRDDPPTPRVATASLRRGRGDSEDFGVSHWHGAAAAAGRSVTVLSPLALAAPTSS